MPEEYRVGDQFKNEWERIRDKVDGVRGPFVHNSPAAISHADPQGPLPDLVTPAPNQLVTVAIIGTETGGGYYKGSIYFGASNGGGGGGSSPSAPGTFNFQLQATTGQSQTDGPACKTNTDGSLVNNALVVNLFEPFLNGTHLLWGNTVYMVNVTGRIMGVTNEATPRTIVYVDNTPLFPVIAKITGTYESSYGGVYYGRAVQGQFCTGSNFGYAFPLSSLNPAFLPDAANCWITNQWEQTYGAASRNSLANDTYVWGIMVGYPQYSIIEDGNTSATNIWVQIYTWFPPQSATLVHPVLNLTTSQTANSTYAINEQTMLNNLKTDVTNIQAALSNLYANLKAAGYSL